MEIELVPDPGPDDPGARAARSALERELANGSSEAEGDWRLVPHSEAWRLAAVKDAVGRSDGLGAGAPPAVDR